MRVSGVLSKVVCLLMCEVWPSLTQLLIYVLQGPVTDVMTCMPLRRDSL